MTDDEIQKLLEQITFDKPKDTEVIVNVPLYVPKVLFSEGIFAFAKFKGWSGKEDDCSGALQYLASFIRTDVKNQFTRFVQAQATTQAYESAKEQIDQIFNS